MSFVDLWTTRLGYWGLRIFRRRNDLSYRFNPPPIINGIECFSSRFANSIKAEIKWSFSNRDWLLPTELSLITYFLLRPHTAQNSSRIKVFSDLLARKYLFRISCNCSFFAELLIGNPRFFRLPNLWRNAWMRILLIEWYYFVKFFA